MRADAVRVYADVPADSLYRLLHRHFASAGYDIEEGDREMGTFRTGFRDIGEGTRMQARAFIEEDGGGSVATLRGRWGVTGSVGAGLGAIAPGSNFTEATEEAEWRNNGTRFSQAFAELAIMAKRLPNATVDYVVE